MTAAAQKLWEPSPKTIEASNMTRYMRWLESERGLEFGGDYGALWRWSTAELDDFWASIWEFFEVTHSAPYERVLGKSEMPGAEWFVGTRLNYAENLLSGRPDEALAIQHASELRELDSLSWGELRDQVARAAASAARSRRRAR